MHDLGGLQSHLGDGIASVGGCAVLTSGARRRYFIVQLIGPLIMTFVLLSSGITCSSGSLE